MCLNLVVVIYNFQRYLNVVAFLDGGLGLIFAKRGNSTEMNSSSSASLG